MNAQTEILARLHQDQSVANIKATKRALMLEWLTPAEAQQLIDQTLAEQPVSKFKAIALRSVARGESRVLPIKIGEKKPAIKWADSPIDMASAEEWGTLFPAWIETQATKFPDLNCAVIAKPYEKLFTDEDESDRFRRGYEQFAQEPFPRTFTTSARPDRCQGHWLQTDRTRAMGNITQGDTVGSILSVRQNNLYVLAEGSTHKNGIDIYKVVDDSPIAPMPDKLVDYIESLRINKVVDGSGFAKRSDDWLNDPFIHHNIDNLLCKFAGHFVAAKNINDADQLEVLLLHKLEKNGCFTEDGKTPFNFDRKRVREIAEDKAKTWKTGEQKKAEARLSLDQHPTEPKEPTDRYAITDEEMAIELEKDYPVIPLVEQAGPDWDDSVMYGVCGDIIRKASQYCESHPAGMYLDLLVAIGNIIGRGPYFNITQTRHYTNEFMCRVGLTSESRKGTGRDVVDEVLRIVDGKWYSNRVLSGFGSAEAIVNELRDPMEQQVADRKIITGFRAVTVPGVTDKRLCIREGELASVFQLAGKNESRADIVLRDGWDGKALRNLVKGKTREGLSNSAVCQEPHLSISGDTTKAELLAKLPDGAADNGFGNRFLYCYVYRTKLCPNGGPQTVWSDEVSELHQGIEWARTQTYVPLTKAASKVWIRMYMELDQPGNKLPGLAGKMVARSAAHIRRLALIYALLDRCEAVDTCHLHAARAMWDYCQESARFIFLGTTGQQDRIRRYLEKNGPLTVSQIRRRVFHDHKKFDWVQAQVDALVKDASAGVEMTGDLVSIRQNRK